MNPLLVPLMISNMAAGNVAIQFGLKGKCINVVTACATGTHSIGEAFRSIQYGEADVMVAGGTEASITPIGVAGFTALTALTTSEDPEKASIPFDKDRNGFVMGEGAGIVVLESLEHALGQRSEDLRGGRRLRSYLRRIPHHLPGGGWKRSSQGHDGVPSMMRE